MITPLLQLALEPIVSRRRQVRLLWSLALCWAFFAALAWAHVLPAATLALLAGLSAFVIWKITARWEPDYRAIARLVEQRHPELHALLLTAVEQQPDKHGRLQFLQQRVVQEAVIESRKHSWIDAVPTSRWAGAVFVQFALLITLAVSLARLEPTKRHSTPVAGAREEGVSITPGDTELERGAGLIVLAQFGRDVPNEVALVVQPANQPAQRIALVKNLDDPVFGGGLPEVDGDLTYHVEYAGQTTREFKVTVFEHPRLERADATLTFPDYTGLSEKQIPDTRRITAVEGTKLSVEFQLNKPVKSAKLIAKDKSEIPLVVDAGRAVASLREWPLMTGETYEVQLVDAEGRANKLSAQLIVEVLPNRRPDLKFTAPRGDQSVTSLQEVGFKADIWDDFGMPAYGLSYTVAGQPEKELVLGREAKADEKRVAEHLLKFEELGVVQDQLVSWYLWADDIGRDGQPRRTASDMFFAEVRPFEEIFRPGQEGGQQQQQQSGGGNAAQQQANSQKQIIVATWNLKRAEEARAGATVSETYLKDEPVILEAQDEGLKKALEMQERIEDPRSRALMEAATKAMQTAVEHLTAAAQTVAPLPDALKAEQAAYNALLKLAAHEYEVTRNRSQSGERRGEQARQGELDQLEMKEEQNRYETKSEAQPQQNQEQREQLAILNRLKELAQRQGDINERLKEMQTALQEAKTEQEKEELRRQLKRLREEEQQLLADMDEAKQKMDQSASAPQLAEERKQLEQTRGEAQQAAEAMQQNSPAQALAAGTRAQRELQQLRDDFRKKTSGQFNDALREMRNDARELAQNQQELAEKLAEPDAQKQRTLDSSSPREQLQEKFAEQQKGLGGLRENMREVSEQAESAEPLLAKELYDALRKNTQAGTDQTLDRAGQLATRGFAPQARKFEEKARQEIEELKTGVERAAESVLGNEAEALRTARAELDELRQQLDRELAQARPDLADARQQTPGSAPVPGVGEGVPPSRSSQEGDSQEARAESEPTSNEVRPGEIRARPGNQPPRDGQQDDRGQRSEPRQTPGKQADQRAEQGQEPGRQPGGERPGEQQSGNERGQPRNESGQQQGSQQQGGQQGGQQQSGEQQGGQQQAGQQPGTESGGQQNQGNAGSERGSSSDSPNGSPNDRLGARLRDLARDTRRRGGSDNGGGNRGGAEINAGPLRGEDFVEWSDRLRNVEEMLDEPRLRNEVAQVRELAQAMRAEFKRHSVEPKWDVVKSKISVPLAELRDRLSEELARRDSKDALVPIDRDPVPPKYTEHVRRYYEELGRSR